MAASWGSSIRCHVLNPDTWSLCRQLLVRLLAEPPFVLAAALCGGCRGLCFPGCREPPPSPVLSPGVSFPAPEAQLCSASETTDPSAW